jgi:hypothetical protein
MTPTNLILRSFMHMHLQDSLREPEKGLLSTSEANVTSHMRSSLDILRKFHRELDRFQVDITQTGIAIHKRGQPQNGDQNVCFLWLEIHKIEGFEGDPRTLGNQRKKRRLMGSLERLDALRNDEKCCFNNSAIAVISGPRILFLRVNDEGFKCCAINNIPAGRQERFIDIIDRVIYITKENDFADRSIFQAKVLAYEKEADQIMQECVEHRQIPALSRTFIRQVQKEARIEGHL